MLGELEYADKLFPEDTVINLRKNKTIADNGTEISNYVGESDSKKEFLQFAG